MQNIRGCGYPTHPYSVPKCKQQIDDTNEMGQFTVANSAGVGPTQSWDNSAVKFFLRILNFNIAFYKLKFKLLK